MAAPPNLINTVTDPVVLGQLPVFFEHYPKLNKTNCALWFGWSKSKPDKVTFEQPYVCHASMTWQRPGLDEMVTAVPNSDKLALGYLRMLIKGPFRGFADKISLNQVDGHYYLHIHDLDKWPANVLYNFCIATRIPIERPEWLPYWVDLVVDSKIEPTLAFLLSYSRGGIKTGARYMPTINHLWFDTSSDWSRIVKGDMVTDKLHPSYATKPDACRPCNVIWGRSTKTYKFIDMSDKQIQESLGLLNWQAKGELPKPKEYPVPAHKPVVLKPWKLPVNGQEPNWQHIIIQGADPEPDVGVYDDAPEFDDDEIA